MSQENRGVIRADEAYSKATLMTRMNISQRTWDKLLDEGLPYTQIGHNRWVAGSLVLEYLNRHSTTKNATNEAWPSAKASEPLAEKTPWLADLKSARSNSIRTGR